MNFLDDTRNKSSSSKPRNTHNKPNGDGGKKRNTDQSRKRKTHPDDTTPSKSTKTTKQAKLKHSKIQDSIDRSLIDSPEPSLNKVNHDVFSINQSDMDNQMEEEDDQPFQMDEEDGSTPVSGPSDVALEYMNNKNKGPIVNLFLNNEEGQSIINCSTFHGSKIKRIVESYAPSVEKIYLLFLPNEGMKIFCEDASEAVRYSVTFKPHGFIYWRCDNKILVPLSCDRITKVLSPVEKFDFVTFIVVSKPKDVHATKIRIHMVKKRTQRKRESILTCADVQRKELVEIPPLLYKYRLTVSTQTFTEIFTDLNGQSKMAVIGTDFHTMSISAHSSIEVGSGLSTSHELCPTRTETQKVNLPSKGIGSIDTSLDLPNSDDDTFCRLYFIKSIITTCRMKSLSDTMDILPPIGNQRLPLTFVINLTQACTCELCTEESRIEKKRKAENHLNPSEGLTTRSNHFNIGDIKISVLHLVPRSEETFALIRENIFRELKDRAKKSDTDFLFNVTIQDEEDDSKIPDHAKPSTRDTDTSNDNSGVKFKPLE